MLHVAEQMVRKAESFALRRAPLWVFERLVPRQTIAFCYHTIAAEPLPHVKHLYLHKTPQEFEDDLVYLKRRYHLPRYEEWLEQPAGSDSRRLAIVTFDDGMSQCFDYARPILLKHNVPCIFFVTTNFIDNQHLFYRHKASLCIERLRSAGADDRRQILRQVNQAFGGSLGSPDEFAAWIKGLSEADEASIDRVCLLMGVDVADYLATARPYLTTGQIRELAAEGFTIGAHSRRHPLLGQLEDPADVEAEITESCRIICELTGADQVPFAFPYSGQGVDRELLRRIVEQHSCVGRLFDTIGIEQDEPFIQNRIWADPPSEPPRRGSNLPSKIHRAYKRHFAALRTADE